MPYPAFSRGTCVVVGFFAFAAVGSAQELDARTLLQQNFEDAAPGRPPWPIQDDSGWAGATVPMRVVDSGDPRFGHVLEANVSGFAQIILGRLKGVETGGAYRISLSLSTTGAQQPTVLLRKGRSPYTAYISSNEATGESMQPVSFLGKSAHQDHEDVLLMLILKGVTTLRVDNLQVDRIVGDLPVGPPPVPGNLLPNAGFELASDGWFVRGTAAFADNPDAFEGHQAPTLAPNGILSSSWLRLSTQGEYLVRARVRTRAPSARVLLGMSNYMFPRGGSGGKAESCELTPDDGWKVVGFRWRPPGSLGKITDWAEFYVSIRNAGRPGASLLVDAVEVKAILAEPVTDQFEPASQSELAVATDAPQNVATRGEKVTVIIRASADLPTTTLRFLDESGQPRRSQQLSLVLGRAEACFSDIPCGYWRLVTRTPPGPGATRHIEGETLLAIVPPMPDRPIADWAYGCHIPPTPAVRDACWKLGLRWNRFHDTCKTTKWPRVQREEGTWRFGDETVDQHRSAGHGLIGSLAGLPAWVPRAASQGDNGKPSPPKAIYGNAGMVDETFLPWEEYARRCAAHWRGTIDVWEVTNEPNLSGISPAEYMKILRAACRGVKRGNPDALVVGLGGASPANATWILDTIRAGASRHADVLSFHGYGLTTWTCTVGPERLIATVARIRAVLAEAGTADMPLWDSECGATVRTAFRKFHVPHGGDPVAAARMFPKSAAAIKAAGIARVLYYSAHETTHAGDGGLRWLCDFNGVVKMPAVPLAVAIAMLEGTRYAGRETGATSLDTVDLRFAGRHRTVRMVWAVKGMAPYRLPASRRRTVNMWGRDIPAAEGTVEITADPVYIVCDRASS